MNIFGLKKIACVPERKECSWIKLPVFRSGKIAMDRFLRDNLIKSGTSTCTGRLNCPGRPTVMRVKSWKRCIFYMQAQIILIVQGGSFMKWGILATGMIARKFADTVNRMAGEGEKLIAAGSRSAEKAKAFAEEFGIPKYYGSYEELAADPDIDAVYIASPNNLHKEHTVLCLNAGKHVLCEKPFTTNAQDAEELYELGREKGLFVMEAFWIRFLPMYELLLKKIRENEFGALRYARCDYGFIARGARREKAPV